MSLYSTVRPTQFSEIVGHGAVVRSLERIVGERCSRRDVPHAFLFSGPTGTGKTTLARILMRAFGCSEESIAELNAANTRGIDTVRAVAENAGLSTLGGGSRGYIVDESHQLSSAASEAFLKVIEDCPRDCFFAFCTTAPESLLKTLRARCTTFALSALRPNELEAVVAEAEHRAGINEIDHDVLSAIIAASDGSARAALVLREQVAGLEKSEALSLVQKNVGDAACGKTLAQALVARGGDRWALVVAAYKEAKDQEPEGLRRMVLGYLHSCLLGSKGGAADMFAAKIEALAGPPVWTRAEFLVMLYRAAAA